MSDNTISGGVWDDPAFVATWNATYGMDMSRAPIRPGVVYPWIADIVGNFSGKKLIDLGCGNGNLIHHFRDAAFASWVGVDPGKAVLESARDHIQNPRIDFLHASATDPSLRSELGHCGFDAATAIFVLEEISNDSLQGLCSNIRKLLSRQGQALIFSNHPINAFAEDFRAALANEPNKKFEGHKGYFDRSPLEYTLSVMNYQNGHPDKAEYHHKTIGDIVNAFAREGLFLKKMLEVPYGVLSYGDIKTREPKAGDLPRFAGFVFGH